MFPQLSAVTCILAMLAANVVAGNEAPASFPLPYMPAVGETREITIVRNKIRIENGTRDEQQATVVASLRILSELPDGYEVEWTTKRVTAGAVRIEDDPTLLVGVPIRIELSADSSPRRISDWPSMRRSLLQFVSRDRPDNQAAIEKVRNLINSWTSETAAQALLPELRTIAICQGTDLPLRQEVTSNYQVPNLFGGEPFDAIGSYFLSSVDPSISKADIRWNEKWDEEQATKAIRATMKGMGGDPETAGDFKFSNHQTAECHVHMKSGEAGSVRFSSEVEIVEPSKYATFVDERTITITGIGD